jgi:hypothetical protein
MFKHNASSKQLPSADWASHEFAHAKLSDERLVKRLIIIATDYHQSELLDASPDRRPGAHPQKHLWDFLSAQRLSARLKIHVPRTNGLPARLATVAIRFAPVTLRPPCLKEDQAPVTLWAVEARETRPPKGVTPVCWRLLTTLPVTTAQVAVEKVRWYAQRWQIEVIHKVLKSGSQVEQRQLESAPRLARVVMVDLIVAWRVLGLCKAGRETPDGLASDWLSAEEWRALWCYVHERARPPSLRQAGGGSGNWADSWAGGGMASPVRSSCGAGCNNSARSPPPGNDSVMKNVGNAKDKSPHSKSLSVLVSSCL